MKSNLNVFFLVIVVEFCSRSLTVASLVMIFIQQLVEEARNLFRNTAPCFCFYKVRQPRQKWLFEHESKANQFLFKLTLYLIFILYKFRQ